MTSLIDAVRPQEKSFRLLFDVLMVLAGSLFIALLAQVEILMVPVPFTLQTLGVLLIGGVLGAKRGALSIITYIVEGVLGLPFFAGGAAGIARLCGPTGGYLVGFIAAAFLVGLLLERGSKERLSFTIPVMFVGTFCILFFGSLWLSFFVVSMDRSFALGVIPFLLSDCIKAVIAATLIPSGWKLLRHFST